MFAIICLNIMLLISCWYLIAENQKNKNKINGLEDDLNKAIKRLATLEEGVTQKSWLICTPFTGQASERGIFYAL